MTEHNILSDIYDDNWGNGIKTIIVGTMPGQESLDGKFIILANVILFGRF